MQSLAEILIGLWGRKRAKALMQEYRQAFTNRPLLMADLAKVCEVGAMTPNTVKKCVEQTAKQQVFAHIARMLNLEPKDFIDIVDGKDLND